MHLLPGWTLRAHDPAGPERKYRKIWTDDRDLTTLKAEGEPARYRMDFADLVSLEILPDKREIVRRDKVASLPQSTFEHVLADQVAPRILAHEGQFVVHAAAVRQADSALLFIGDSGSGKSTLAASFSQSGWTLMGDDGVIIDKQDGRLVARAIYPSLRLFPDSIEKLFDEPVNGQPMAHYSTKQHIPEDVVSRATDRTSGLVQGIMLLLPATDGEIIIRRLPQADTCVTLIENSFALDPTDLRQAQILLENASRLAGAVPTFAIEYPRQYHRLEATRDAILSAVEARSTGREQAS